MKIFIKNKEEFKSLIELNIVTNSDYVLIASDESTLDTLSYPFGVDVSDPNVPILVPIMHKYLLELEDAIYLIGKNKDTTFH